MPASFNSKHRTPYLKEVCGRFETDGTTTPSVIVGEGFTVAYAATGVFTVTFDAAYTHLISATAHLQAAATSEHQATVTSFTIGTDSANATLVITVSLLAAGAYAGSATSDGDSIHFVAKFQDTGVDGYA
jgi:hypothetical protein